VASRTSAELHLWLVCVCRCRPEAYPYTLGLMLIGGLMIVLTLILLVVLFFRYKRGSSPTSKSGTSKWRMEYVGLVLVAACFFVAWGFGLPATRPLSLGILRFLFQIVFLVFSALCGVFMLFFFCLLSPQVRDALCCRKKGHFDITERPYFPKQRPEGDGDHVYVMEDKNVKDEGEGGLHYKNEGADITFTENLYEPYEEAAPPSVDVAFVEPGREDQEPDIIKKNLATLDNKDEEAATKL